jgi:hypothetical protein
LFYRTQTNAVVAPKNGCSSIEQLPLFDYTIHRTSAFGSPNNGSCFIEQLQGFTEPLTEQLLFLR